MKKIILLHLCFILFSCHSSMKISKKNNLEQIISKIAAEEFGEKYAVIANDKNTHSIVFKNYKKLSDLFPEVRFIIIDHKTGDVVFKDQLKAGTVNWHSDYEIIAIARNLNPNDNEGSTSRIYYYHVLSKENR